MRPAGPTSVESARQEAARCVSAAGDSLVDAVQHLSNELSLMIAAKPQEAALIRSAARAALDAWTTEFKLAVARHRATCAP